MTHQPSAAVAAKADRASAALALTWQHLARALPGAWGASDGGAVALVTGVGVPELNGVWAERADPDPGAVAGLLDRVRATGLPHCLQLRPGASPALAGLAAAGAMSPDEDIPLMVMEDPAAVSGARPLAGLVLRELSPEQVGLHVRVLPRPVSRPRRSRLPSC